MRNRVLCYSVIIALITFSVSCSTEGGNSTNNPGTPKISESQAIFIAQTIYGIEEITSVEIRHLTNDELKKLEPENQVFSPIFYIIDGLKSGEMATTYVSTMNEKLYFSNEE